MLCRGYDWCGNVGVYCATVSVDMEVTALVPCGGCTLVIVGDAYICVVCC